MRSRALTYVFFALGLFSIALPRSIASVIEEQLQEIGSIPNDEVVVVQRKYTRKQWRSEFTPVALGGVPFGTVRRNMFGGAGYTLHFNDWLGWEALNFVYTKAFFTGFVDDINRGQMEGGKDCLKSDSTLLCINVDYQKLLYFVTSGFVLSPFYGKLSTFSRYIAYAEPYIYLGAGIARTEANTYLAGVPGVGIRVFFKEWFSLRFEFRDYIYSERSTDLTSGDRITNMRNNYAFMLSLSFWLPKMPSY